jgi:hypothetical protein
MELYEFLQYLASASGAAVVASFILERIPAFQRLASEWKRWVFFGACGVLSLGSYLVLNYVPAEILSYIAPYFAMVAGLFTSVFVGGAFHKINKEEAKG